MIEVYNDIVAVVVVAVVDDDVVFVLFFFWFNIHLKFPQHPVFICRAEAFLQLHCVQMSLCVCSNGYALLPQLQFAAYDDSELQVGMSIGKSRRKPKLNGNV